MSALDILNAVLRGQVGEQKIADGNGLAFRQGRRAQMITSNLGGLYGESSSRQRLFIGSTPAAGVTIPIFSNTTQQFVLYNPIGSGKIARIIKASVGYVSGTHVAGHLCYAQQTLLSSPVTGTGALVNNAYLGQAAGGGSKLQLFTAATVVALSYLMPFGVSTVVQAATATNAPWQMVDNVDGAISVPPGSALAIAANVAAIMVATCGLVWEEDDIDA